MPRAKDDAALLEKLVLGRLPVAEVERLAAEYADDERLTALAEAAAGGNDTLLASLRHHETLHDPKAEGLVARLIARLKAGQSSSMGETIGVEEPSAPDGEAIPESLEYFRIRKLLGQGGMGMVFLADDTRLGRPVALKTLKRELAANPAAKDRFLREARSAARLEHDHIIPIYYVGESDGTPFLAMPFLQGEPLDARLRREGADDRDPVNQFARMSGESKPLAVPEAARIGYQVALGLAVAHQQGLIHRDIKPANVWLEAPSGRVKILDFGLARSQSETAQLTVSGTIMGTPAYMAPEQARGKAVDARADLFSLGVMLYEMTTGRRPFTGEDTMAILSSLALDDPTPPRQLNDEVPGEFSDLIMALLSKNPEQRPADAGRVAEALMVFVQTEVGRVPHGPSAGVGKNLGVVGATSAMFGEFAQAAAAPRADKKKLAAKTARATPAVAKRRTLLVPIIAAAALLLVGGGFAAYKLMFETKEGTLIVEVDGDADVRFKDGELLIFDADGKQKYVLKPGQRNQSVAPGRYTVSVAGADGVRLQTDKFEMMKAGRVSVRVTAVAPAIARRDPPSPARANQKLRFNGKNTYVDVPSLNETLSTLKNWTVELQLDKDPAQSLAQVWYGGGLRTGFWFNTGQWIVREYEEEGCSSPKQGSHFCVVRSGNKLTMYIDGAKVASVDGEAATWKEPTHFRIGAISRNNDDNLDRFFNGTMDEIRISKVARYSENYLPVDRFEPDDETVALYHCDETGGERLTDSSGNGHHGKVVAGEWVRRDPTGGEWSLTFNGGGEVGLGRIALDTSAPFTVEAWVRCATDDFPAGVSLITLAPNVGLRTSRQNKWAFSVGDLGVAFAKPYSLRANEWVHVAGVRSEKEVRIYVDGKDVGHASVKPGRPEQSAAVIAGGMNGFHGQVGPVRISKGARYGKEFLPKRRFEPDADTVALYHCDEGSGEVLKDSSGNRHHGKVVGGEWVKSDAAPAPSGSAGPDYALRFNGPGEYVQISGVKFDVSKPWTVEAWVNCPDPQLREGGQMLVLSSAKYYMFLGNWTGRGLRWCAQSVDDPEFIPFQEPAKLDQWVHLAAVHDGQAITLFVDGVPQTVPNRAKLPKEEVEVNFGPSEYAASEGRPGFRGMMDEIRYSSVARYKERFIPQRRFEPDGDTLGLAHCDEGKGDNLKDSSGNGRHAVIVGAKWVKREDKSDSPAWQSLFNGKDLAGWEAIPPDTRNGWTVADGVLRGSGNKSDIATTAEFGDFELELEFRLTMGANGGVIYRWGGEHQLTVDDGPYLHAPEYQIVDNKDHPNGRQPLRTNASVFQMFGPTGDTTVEPGGWHKARIVARGNRLEHWLDEKKVVECEIGSADWNQRLSQWRSNPAYGKALKGRIALQSHTAAIDYRNVRIRPLAAPAAKADPKRRTDE